MAARSSLRGWSPASRAPALRREATRLEEQVAPRHPFPDRVLRLARELRTRAAAVECGAPDDAELAREALLVERRQLLDLMTEP